MRARCSAQANAAYRTHKENFSYTGNYLIIYQVCAHVAERWPMQHTETMVRLAVERTAQVCVLMCSYVFLCVLMCTHGALGR